MERLVRISTPIKGLFIVRTIRIEDERGHLSRLFCSREIEGFGWRSPLNQVNFTRTLQEGTVRGFHFQRQPHAEYKYVRCIRGEVFDVALDLRENSKSFLQTFSQTLTDENDLGFLIPPGVAHGFQSLTNNTELLYMHSEFYVPDSDCGINPMDPQVSAEWPREISTISQKDASQPFLPLNYKGMNFELSPLP